MIMTFIPATDGIVAVLGIETDDVARMVGGDQPDVIDFRRLFESGQPFPSALQILYCRDEAHYEEMLRRMFPGIDLADFTRGTDG